MVALWRKAKPQPIGASPHAMGLIELRDVLKVYQSAAGNFTALDHVSLQVHAGEFVAMVGKSGSGKSTLINMITGIDRPSGGTVLVGGTAVQTLSESQMAVWRGRNVGIVFQFFQLLPALSLLENVMLPMDFAHMYPPRERHLRALALLDKVGMAAQADKLPAAVSGGQQQRVAIARALANDPPILIADEPTGNLDSQTAEQVFALFEDLVKQGKTIVMVTHDNDLARRASRSVIVADGRIVDEYVVSALPLLSIDQLTWVARRLETHTYAPGTEILSQGAPADSFYIITNGHAEVRRQRSDGQETVVNQLERGSYFGEIGLLQGSNRTATVRATDHVEAVALDRAEFEELLADAPGTRDAIRAYATARAGNHETAS